MPAPTPFEQELLELINRARLDPQGEFALMIADSASQTGAQRNITSALQYFNVDLTSFAAQLTALPQVAPLAWEDRLAQAAGKHTQRMIAEDSQSHQLPGEARLGDRISAEGYTWNAVGENIYAYTNDPVHGHAGFYVDWGFDAEDFDSSGALHGDWQQRGDGIQDPAGHRITILSDNYVDIGISAEAEADPATEVGPWVVTQNFGSQFTNSARILGVVFADDNADGHYTAGEGVSGITWSLAGSTVSGWDSGGFQLAPSGGGGAVQVSAAGSDFAGPAVATLELGAENAKLDLVQQGAVWGWRSSSSLTLEQTIDHAVLLGAQNLSLTSTDVLSAHLTGNAGANVLTGAAGDDTALGGAGADTLFGGDGADSLLGEAGADRLHGGAGGDILHGGAGNDTVHGDDGRDRVYLGFGDDVFVDNGQGGADGSDTVFGWAGNDLIQGGNGDDVFHGNSGEDVLHGRLGNDRLFGGSGYDTIYAGAGNDTVWGGAGRDLIFLGGGSDLFRDTAQGGVHGRDTVWAGAGADTLQGGQGDDIYYGEAGDDVIWAREGADRAFGGGGTDRLYAGQGDDTVFGGDGSDLGFLGDGHDIWFDSDDAAGHDFVFGAAGDDTIEMRGGNDTAVGAAGADTFVLSAPNGGAHRIEDFETGVDAVRLNAALWSGAFDAARFAELADTSSGSLVLALTSGSLTLAGITESAGIFDDLLLI